MKKIGLYFFALVLVSAFGCGQSGNKSQTTAPSPDRGTYQDGPGRGGRGGGRGQFNPEDFAARQTEQMSEFIRLSEEQKQKVYDLNLLYSKKSQELRSGGSFRDMSDGEREAFREKMNALQEEKSLEIKKILNEDQLPDYEKYQEEMRSRMRDRMLQRPQQ